MVTMGALGSIIALILVIGGIIAATLVVYSIWYTFGGKDNNSMFRN